MILMPTAEKASSLDLSEEAAANHLKKAGLYLLDMSIRWFEDPVEQHLMLAASNLQIAMELLLKAYICRVYGFARILTKKSSKLRSANPTAYQKELTSGQIRTLGFDELKEFLREQADTFSPVIEKGRCPCFGIPYTDLEDSFLKFQSIRNAFFHLGLELSESDARWLSIDFFSILTVFLSLLLREIDRVEDEDAYHPSLYEDDEEEINLWSTPMDILKHHLSPQTLSLLRNDDKFMDNLCDYAMEAYDSYPYRCLSCGKKALFPDIYDGFVKCVSCGECFQAFFADCAICRTRRSVIYDGWNIDIPYNKNIMPGYCYHCGAHPKVYQCPVCGRVYSYSHHAPPSSFEGTCCKKHFHDRQLPAFADC